MAKRDETPTQKAVRERLKKSVSAQKKAQLDKEFAKTKAPARGGVMEALGNGGDMSDDEFDYWVDIARRDVMDKNGEVIGWDKNVHRHRDPKGSPPIKKKGFRRDV